MVVRVLSPPPSLVPGPGVCGVVVPGPGVCGVVVPGPGVCGVVVGKGVCGVPVLVFGFWVGTAVFVPVSESVSVF